jgi:hypothetical protein
MEHRAKQKPGNAYGVLVFCPFFLNKMAALAKFYSFELSLQVCSRNFFKKVLKKFGD